MNPLMLFLFCFLAVSFALILVQKDLTKWQKFSLVANPALLALCVVLLLEKSRNDREYAADIAPVVNISADLLANPGSAEALKAADRIRIFTNDSTDQNWKKLGDDLKKLIPAPKNSEKN